MATTGPIPQPLQRGLAEPPRALPAFGKAHIHALPIYEPRALPDGGIARHFANENPLGPSPRVVAALREAADRIHCYPDAKATRVRHALGEQFQIDPELIACCNGSDEVIALLAQALVGGGENVVMSAGSFVTFAVRSAATGARVVRVPLRDYRHDLDAMAAAIDRETRVVFVCNPNNPTGTITHEVELTDFLKRVPERVIVVVDEAYAEFVDDLDYPRLTTELRAGRENLLILRTFAKAYGLAGLRIGYSMANPRLLHYLEKLRPIFSVNSLAQVAALSALQDRAHLRESISYAQSCRSWFHQRLTGMGHHPVLSQANFILLPVRDDLATAERLSALGFWVAPLSAWGLPHHLRISFGSPAQNERLLEALSGCTPGKLMDGSSFGAETPRL